MSNVTPPANGANQHPPKWRRLWLWFITGFFLVFVGLAIVYPMQFYDGRAVYQTPLWRYYLLEIQQKLNSSGAIGPTSGNSTGVLITVVTHVVISAIAGTAAMAIGWVFQKRS